MSVVLPGDVIGSVESLSQNENVLRIGTGIIQDEDELIATKAGLVRLQKRGNKIWVENNQKRFYPLVEDMVIGVVVDKHTENYRVDIQSFSQAVLPVLAFEGATKRNRPHLQIGSLIYARVVVSNKDMEPELSCESTTNKKGWMSGQTMFGELTDGFVFDCSIGYARSLLSPDSIIVNELGRYIPYEIAVGVNGRVWVKTEKPPHTILIVNAILNAEFLNKNQIQIMVKKLIERSK